MRKPRQTRHRDQAAYQREYRRQQKAVRKPSRDDVARVALHWVITEALRREREDDLVKLCDLIRDRLVGQGFDRDAASRRIDDLIARYESGWDFQRKPHLKSDAAT